MGDESKAEPKVDFIGLLQSVAELQQIQPAPVGPAQYHPFYQSKSGVRLLQYNPAKRGASVCTYSQALLKAWEDKNLPLNDTEGLKEQLRIGLPGGAQLKVS